MLEWYVEHRNIVCIYTVELAITMLLFRTRAQYLLSSDIIMHYTAIYVITIYFSYAHCFGLFNFDHDVLKYDDNVKHNATQVSEEWIEQPLDHFSDNDRTWNMRYFKRLDLWKPGGPIYLYINGEWNASPKSLQSDTLLTCQLAKETHGAMFSTEHRYYGASMPVHPTTTPWLKYLSSKQALADLAKLIKVIKSAPEFKTSKVVAVGGSYAGNLAAWVRLIYPDLVDAAVSSSGPVLAKKDFFEYLETVNDVYEEFGTPDCINRIQRRFKMFTELMKTSDGIKALKRDMNICDNTDMSILENQELFFMDNFGTFQGKTQYGTPDTIKQHCQELEANNWTRSMPNSRDNECNDYDFQSLIVGETSLKSTMFYWLYQCCTEFGYFQTASSSKQPFGNKTSVELYVKLCKGIFGDEFDENRVDDGVARSNALYGGITPKLSNVVFTHGSMDPWHRLGVLKDLSETATVRITHGSSHCKILNQSTGEPDDLTIDREYVKALIKKWIA